MAKYIEAFQAYGPRLELSQTAQLDEVVDWMARSTGINKSEVMMVLQELQDLIHFYNRRGIPIKLPGVGIFSPSINGEGKFKINFRADNALRKLLNGDNGYQGPIRNRENIGLDPAGYKGLWDIDHPEDPLEVNLEAVP